MFAPYFYTFCDLLLCGPAAKWSVMIQKKEQNIFSSDVISFQLSTLREIISQNQWQRMRHLAYHVIKLSIRNLINNGSRLMSAREFPRLLLKKSHTGSEPWFHEIRLKKIPLTTINSKALILRVVCMFCCVRLPSRTV